MLTVARVRPDQWETLKTLRLTALQEAPYAFGSTYAETVTRANAWWQEMAARRAVSPDDCTFFVYDDDTPVGLAGGYRDSDNPRTAYLVSVWIAPTYRGTDAASLVVNAVCNWAASVTATTLLADVTENNHRARRFYEREGFRPTGVLTPYPPEPNIQEIQLMRLLSPGQN